MGEKNKSGKGKFFLGALLGAAAGAIAGKCLSKKQEEPTTSDDPVEDCEDKKK